MIELRGITEDNFDECVDLRVREDQKEFVAPNMSSLAEAYVALTNEDSIPTTFGIYDGDTMVGFSLITYNEKIDEENTEVSYWICRFMIDEKYQGKGFGKEGMENILDYIKTLPNGDAKTIYLSYEPENEVAKALYASLGFEETGRILWDEMVAKLSI